MGSEFKRRLWNSVKGKKRKFSAEVINRRKNGGRYITRLRVFPVLSESNEIEYILGIEKDITAARQIDETKAEFISLASHQLRTPLTNISLGLEILMRDPACRLSGYQEDCVRGIFNDVHDMADLVSTLLDASKIRLGSFIVELRKVDIIQAAENALTHVAPEMNAKNIRLIKEYDPGLRSMMSDRNVVKAILSNLLSNAVKYTSEKGIVSFKIKKQRNGVLFLVSDSGWGIPAADKNKIFSKYFRAGNVEKKDARGSGLGLYLTRQLVKSLQGRIWFKSRENEGTCFFVFLPLYENAGRIEDKLDSSQAFPYVREKGQPVLARASADPLF
jgi:signal transduction histidine kinase